MCKVEQEQAAPSQKVNEEKKAAPAAAAARQRESVKPLSQFFTQKDVVDDDADDVRASVEKRVKGLPLSNKAQLKARLEAQAKNRRVDAANNRQQELKRSAAKPTGSANRQETKQSTKRHGSGGSSLPPRKKAAQGKGDDKGEGVSLDALAARRATAPAVVSREVRHSLRSGGGIQLAGNVLATAIGQMGEKERQKKQQQQQQQQQEPKKGTKRRGGGHSGRSEKKAVASKSEDGRTAPIKREKDKAKEARARRKQTKKAEELGAKKATKKAVQDNKQLRIDTQKRAEELEKQTDEAEKAEKKVKVKEERRNTGTREVKRIGIDKAPVPSGKGPRQRLLDARRADTTAKEAKKAKDARDAEREAQARNADAELRAKDRSSKRKLRVGAAEFIGPDERVVDGPKALATKRPPFTTKENAEARQRVLSEARNKAVSAKRAERAKLREQKEMAKVALERVERETRERNTEKQLAEEVRNKEQKRLGELARLARAALLKRKADEAAEEKRKTDKAETKKKKKLKNKKHRTRKRVPARSAGHGEPKPKVARGGGRHAIHGRRVSPTTALKIPVAFGVRGGELPPARRGDGAAAGKRKLNERFAGLKKPKQTGKKRKKEFTRKVDKGGIGKFFTKMQD